MKSWMRKVPWILALALTLSLTACGGGGGNATTTPTDAPPAATDAPAATDEPKGDASEETQAPAASGDKVKLKLYEVPQDDASDNSKAQFEWFKGKMEAQFPNVEFEWTRMAPGTDYRQQYDQLLMSGDGPTTGHQFPYVDIQLRGKNGTIADLTSYYENWDMKKNGLVTDIFDEAIQIDGKWYAVPWEPYTSAIVYNKAIIQEAGEDPSVIPQTWTEFAEKAKKMTDKSVPRFGYLLLGSDFNAWTFTPWVWSAGGEMVRKNTDGTYSVAFQEDPGVDAAMYMHDLIWKYECTQKDILESYDDYQNHMKSGQACYGWTSPAGYAADELAKYDLKPDDFGFFPLPAKDEGGKRVVFAGGEVWTMNPKATKEQMDAAWELINYQSFNEEYLVEKWTRENDLGLLNGNSTARTDMLEKKFALATNWPENWRTEYAEAGKYAIPEPFCNGWNNLKDEIVKPLQAIFMEENITREKAKEILEKCAADIYERYPDAFKPAN